MALSGIARKTFTNNGGFELIIEWSAKQNIAGNSSSVTATMKLRGIYYWSTVHDATASATSITINGNKKSFNANSSLSGGQTKVLGSHTVTVPHNADGTKTFNVSGSHYFDINWNSGGTSTPSLSNNYTLNTIPRASTGSGANFTFTGNSSISISRASSSFKHKARFHVDGLFIKELTNLTTSGTFNFSDAERKKIVEKMANRTNVQCTVDLWTYNGSTQIGGMYKFSYNVTSPAKAGGSASDFVISTKGFPVSLSNFNTGAKFTYKVSWDYPKVPFMDEMAKTAKFTFPMDQSRVDLMLSRMTTVNSGKGKLIVRSYYDGVQFGGDAFINSITAKVDTVAYAPAIKGGSTFKDTNPATVTATGNNQIIVKSLSNVSVTIPAGLGTAKGSATLERIRVSLGGTTKVVNYTNSATVIELGSTNASSNSNLTVGAIDSRGNTGIWTTPVVVLDYSSPSITPEVGRIGNYESNVKVDMTGVYSRLLVGGAEKNTVTKITYRYKKTSESAWSAEANLKFTATGGKITSPDNVSIVLDNTFAWNLEIKATDKVGSSGTYTYTVPEGIPLMFLDAKLKSMGVNKFPTEPNALQVKGSIDLDGIFKTAPDTYARYGGAFNLNNSDMVGVNGMYFGGLRPAGSKDPADNDGEGLIFPRTNTVISADGKTIPNLNGWDTLKVLDGSAYLNGNPIGLAINDKPLWEGAVYLHSNHKLDIGKNIKECPNGWALRWSRYVDGKDAEFGFTWSYIHKVQATNSGGIYIVISVETDEIRTKYVYVTGGGRYLVGHDGNITNKKNQIILSGVFPW